MGESLRLHTAVRRYLIDRHEDLTKAYSQLPNSGRADDGYHYSDEAIQIYPRYNAADAILFAVEELDPDDLPAFDELTDILIEVCSLGETAFTRGRVKGSEQVIANERRLFVLKVEDLAARLPTPAPLPYRRTLSEAEAGRWASELQRTWGVVDRQWYPLLASPVPEDVTVLREEALWTDGGDAAAKAALNAIGLDRAIELREYRDHGPDRVVGRECFSPTYTGAEGLWTDESVKWIAYASHEGTVAFGGAIRTALERLWPDIDRWRWSGWETPGL
jgi:hypothetical protein